MNCNVIRTTIRQFPVFLTSFLNAKTRGRKREGPGFKPWKQSTGFIPNIEKSSATNVCKATNQMVWKGCCFTGNSNPCAGLTLQKSPEYSLLSIPSLPLTSTKSQICSRFHFFFFCILVSLRSYTRHLISDVLPVPMQVLNSELLFVRRLNRSYIP
jgi:hypothetical protein